MLAPFATQSAASPKTLEFSGERLLNYMLRPGSGVSEANIIGRSGLDTFATVSSLPVQAMVVMGGDLYVASDETLWKVTSAGSVSSVGTLPYNVTRMVTNGSQIGIVGDRSYYLSDGASVTPTAIAALPGGIQDIAFMDQYFVLAGSTGTRDDAVTVSALLDGSTWDPADIAVAEKDPDGIQAIMAVGADLWILGSETYEVWYNAGLNNFPLLPRGISGRVACLGPQATVISNDVLFWVRPDGAVMMANGYQPQNISSADAQQTIRDATVNYMAAFTDRSHDVISVNLDGEPAWAFDLNTGLWHERNTGTSEGEWIATCSVRWDGADYIGTSGGKICQLADDVYADAGDVISAEAETALVDLGGRYTRIGNLYLNIQGGTGVSGRDAEVMLQVRKNGGSWSASKTRTVGASGEHYRRVKWHGLGSAKTFQIRTVITDEIPRDIHGAMYD